MKILLIKTIGFTLLLPGMVAGVTPWLISTSAELGSVYSIFFGLFLMCLGVAIYGWCAWDFVSVGKGTPAPIDAPKHLVVRGLYHYTRNPMYVGVLLFISGWVSLYTMPVMLVYWLGVASLFQILVLFYEEPILQELFGAEYKSYCASVKRWLPSVTS